MLEELHAEISRQGGYDHGAGPEPVVSLELFFDGNEDPASIGCNLSDHPGPARFYEVLSTIRDRPEVHSVWVGVSDVIEPDDWPFSDHVYVVTTASPVRGRVVGSRAQSRTSQGTTGGTVYLPYGRSRFHRTPAWSPCGGIEDRAARVECPHIRSAA